MYVMLCTRPDICFHIGYMARSQENPTKIHWKMLKRILRYLKGTKHLKLMIKREEGREPLIGYSDADWASDVCDRKSVSGFAFQIFGNTISWSSKKTSYSGDILFRS